MSAHSTVPQLPCPAPVVGPSLEPFFLDSNIARGGLGPFYSLDLAHHPSKGAPLMPGPPKTFFAFTRLMFARYLLPAGSELGTVVWSDQSLPS